MNEQERLAKRANEVLDDLDQKRSIARGIAIGFLLLGVIGFITLVFFIR